LLALGTGAEIRLYDPDTGRRLAVIEDPGQDQQGSLTFSPDGHLLLAGGVPSQSVHVWNLRLIRQGLREWRLDWDPPFDSAPGQPGVAPGPLNLEIVGADAEGLNHARAEFAKRERSRVWLRMFLPGPVSAEEHHQRAHNWESLHFWRLALDANARALRHSPENLHWSECQAQWAHKIGDTGRELEALEQITALRPENANLGNRLAWLRLTGPPEHRDPEIALKLIEAALRLAPRNAMMRNTLGLAYARLDRWSEAVSVLESNLSAEFVGMDLVILARCYHHLGQSERATEALERALHWRDTTTLNDAATLADFRTLAEEAKREVESDPAELPDKIFSK
jgi:hypothetical protein